MLETARAAWPHGVMSIARLSPVTLVTGAGSGIGAAAARELARRSTGGLLLVDDDEEALAALADELEAKNLAPERVSTLAVDVSDEARWRQAIEFIDAQYGRLDWVVASSLIETTGELVDWRRADLNRVFLTLDFTMNLMRKNAVGGAIVVAMPAAVVKPENGGLFGNGKRGLLQLIRVAAKEGAANNIRINAVAPGGPQSPMWQSLPWLDEIARELGGERAALDRLGAAATPVARHAAAGEAIRLILTLLSDESAASGATLVVDGGYSL